MSQDVSQEIEFEPLAGEVEANPPEVFARALFEYALDRRATDVFITDDTDATAVIIRHLGHLRVVRRLTRDYGRRLQNHVRALGNADVVDQHHPASGRSLIQLDDQRLVDLRINSIPCLFGQDLAIRLFEHGRGISRLEHLGMLEDELDEVVRMLDAPSGLLLVSGPTGSGKTHSLYAFLDYLNNGHRKIHTLEEPIEFIMPGIVQSQVSRRADLDFSDLLHAALRHSPDVIMIGEIRDERTAQIAIRAAGSGQLVLATVHAQSAVGSIQSMMAYNARPQFLASTLLGVVSQRLVRRLCPQCRREIRLPESSRVLSSIREKYNESNLDRLYAPAGCDHCDHMAFDRLVCIPEILVADEKIRKGIAEQNTQEELLRTALAQGMRPLREACLMRVAMGQVTAEDVYEVLPPEVGSQIQSSTNLPKNLAGETAGQGELVNQLLASKIVEPVQAAEKSDTNTTNDAEQTQEYSEENA